MGPDFRESPELRRIGQIIGQHHAHIIPKGLPGAGNLLVFDNGGSSGYGFASPIERNGHGGLARATSRVLEIDPVKLETVWSYANSGFFSTNISGVQIVWEYMSATTDGTLSTVYRAYRLPYEWIPQLTRPREAAVKPPAGFHAP